MNYNILNFLYKSAFLLLFSMQYVVQMNSNKIPMHLLNKLKYTFKFNTFLAALSALSCSTPHTDFQWINQLVAKLKNETSEICQAHARFYYNNYECAHRLCTVYVHLNVCFGSYEMLIWVSHCGRLNALLIMRLSESQFWNMHMHTHTHSVAVLFLFCFLVEQYFYWISLIARLYLCGPGVYRMQVLHDEKSYIINFRQKKSTKTTHAHDKVTVRVKSSVQYNDNRMVCHGKVRSFDW